MMKAILRVLCSLAVLLALPASTSAQDWRYYGATPGGTKYSALGEINRDNVDDLKVAWTYRTGLFERHPGPISNMTAFQNTPILVDGSLIVCTPFHRIVALDPATGEERWFFDPEVDKDPSYYRFACRGVTPWLDEKAGSDALCRSRIIFGTPDFRIFAIDSGSGARCPDFGTNGEVKLDPGKELISNGEIQVSSPPAVINGIIVVGSFIYDNQRVDAPSGKVRALDARSGALRWEFDPIPRDPNDPAYATWGGDSAKVTGHANVWSIIAVDEERDLVFLPTTSPSNDFYGGTRPGENRYANSIVAVRGSTGEMVWHFQIVHHDVWDYDLPSQPILADINRDGETIPAVIQLTKQGLVFAFHRETGDPLFPIEERPVPQNGMPGEWLSPTQPFPVAPPPLGTMGASPDDAWGFTFVDRWACRQKLKALRHDGVYAPPSREGSLMLPSPGGGANWGGGAFDPERNLLLVSSWDIPYFLRLIPHEEMKKLPKGSGFAVEIFPQEGTPYIAWQEVLLSPLGAPCTPPPWGKLSAVDMAEGTIKWQVPLGSIEKFLPVPLSLELGTIASLGGVIATGGGLAFIAATQDDKFRAFDVEDGSKLWEVDLPAGGQATPMTYEAGGRQFVVLAAGGHAMMGTKLGDYVIAYALKGE